MFAEAEVGADAPDDGDDDAEADAGGGAGPIRPGESWVLAMWLADYFGRPRAKQYGRPGRRSPASDNCGKSGGAFRVGVSGKEPRR